jgi:hypothetical protein
MLKIFDMLRQFGKRVYNHSSAGGAPRRATAPRQRFSPKVEALEDRALPSSSSLFGVVHPAGHFALHHGHPAVAILTPTAGSQVGRYVTLTGQLQGHHGGWPVVLVQPILAGEPWYVQPQVLTVNPDGTFTDSIYVGNASTPAHTRFRLEVILASNQAQAQTLYAEGTTLRKLPPGVPHAQVVIVSRAGTIIVHGGV